MTRIGRVYQPKELIEIDEKKKKRKEVLAEGPPKKKRVRDDEAAEVIKTLKRIYVEVYSGVNL